LSRIPLILIIDDEEIILNIVRKLNQILGYNTLIASSSDQALLLLQQHKPELVLLDILKPGSNSMDIITAIRNNPTTSQTGIIMVSGTDQFNEIPAFIQAGADDFLLKPFNASLFKTRISNTLHLINRRHGMKQMQAGLTDCQTQLHQAEMDRDEFCKELSHDLNNTLAGILMTAELLLMKNPPQHMQAHIEDIMESAENISSQISERKNSLLSTEKSK